MSHEHHYHGKVRYVFSDTEWQPRPGEIQAHRDLGKEFNAITESHGMPAQQVAAHLHVGSRIAKHKGQQRNFNRPRVAPAKAASAPAIGKAK